MKRAKTSRQLALAWDSLEPVPVFGTSTTASSPSFARASSSSRTSPEAKPAGCQRCGSNCASSDTVPVPTRFLPPTWEPPTSGDGSSSWATPCATDDHGPKGKATRGGRNLPREVQSDAATWPTATARDGRRGLSAPDPKWPKGTRNLSEAAWPTASATDWKSVTQAGQRKGQLGEAVLLWPTATAATYGTGQNGCPGDGRESFAGKGAPSLSTLARNWPTATTTDVKASRRHGYMIEGNSGTTLHDAIDIHLSEETPKDGPPSPGTAVLSHTFVESLMGFPPGWMDLPEEDLLRLYAKQRSPK